MHSEHLPIFLLERCPLIQKDSSLFGGSLKKGKGDKAACSYPALKSVGLAAPETVVDGEGDSESDDKSFGVIQSNCYMAFNVSTVMQKGF